VKSKVLLVDDSPLILKAAELFLQGEYQILTARSGPEALQKATSERPNLILMDFHMPGWTGCETRSRLAKDVRTQDIPVVIMTTECEDLGPGIDHLMKPFKPCEIQDKLGQYLRAS
jgi:CheY-like chemotaxis protein